MNKIVREHYPVEKLPEDLRGELAGQSTVTVTIEAEAASAEARASWNELLERIRQLHASGAIKPVTTEEAVARVRALRDEWD